MLKVNQQVQINIVSGNGEFYKTIVQGVGEQTFSIQIPSKGGEGLLLQKNDAVTVSYAAPGGYFEFNTVVAGRVREGDIPLYRLELPDKDQIIQKRDYLRLQLVKKIKYQKQVKIEPTGKTIPADITKEASTRDLSGGGISFVCHEPLPINSLIKIEIDIDDWQKQKKTLSFIAKVLKVKQLADRRDYWNVIATFHEIRENHRDQIVSFVLRKDLERRRLVAEERRN